MGDLKKILVPLDGSKLAETALPMAETLAKAFNASISVMTAYYIVTEGVNTADPQSTRNKEVENYIHKIEKQLRAKGFTADGHVIYKDNTAQTIMDHCTDNSIDLVVMCTHGRGGVGRWLLGSVAEKVVRHANVPVLLVRASQPF